MNKAGMLSPAGAFWNGKSNCIANSCFFPVKMRKYKATHEMHGSKERIMYIIAGLGNPGKEYENTRHNIGFDVIDRLAEEENIAVMESKHKALIGKGYVAGQKVILAKPQTFMNLSGESIREIVDYYKVDDTAELIVISDDISLDVGQIRIRKKGSAGGHNGLKNIIKMLGHDTFYPRAHGCGREAEELRSGRLRAGTFLGGGTKRHGRSGKDRSRSHPHDHYRERGCGHESF